GAAGAASRPGLPTQRAARPRVGLRLPRLHPHRGCPRPAGPREARRGQDLRPEHPDRLGRRVPAGAGGGLSLRLRLLASAAGIVAVSLLLSGALTWLLVRNLELQSAQEQLDRAMITTRPLVLHEQCMFRPRVATSPGVADCPLDDPIDYQERLTTLSTQLGPDRLLLLNGQRRV